MAWISFYKSELTKEKNACIEGISSTEMAFHHLTTPSRMFAVFQKSRWFEV